MSDAPQTRTAGPQHSHRFALDQPAARRLVARALRRYQTGRDGGPPAYESLLIAPAWNPRSADEVGAIDELLHAALTCRAITCPGGQADPDGYSIGFHPMIDQDGAAYQWQVLLPPGQPFCLASHIEELRHVGDPATRGARQALAILREAVSQANTMLAAWQPEPRPLVGSDFTAGASDEPVPCGCGEPITCFRGSWLHIINPDLRGTDDHHAQPLLSGTEQP
jgi:hypothetical protein